MRVDHGFTNWLATNNNLCEPHVCFQARLADRAVRIGDQTEHSICIYICVLHGFELGQLQVIALKVGVQLL